MIISLYHPANEYPIKTYATLPVYYFILRNSCKKKTAVCVVHIPTKSAVPVCIVKLKTLPNERLQAAVSARGYRLHIAKGSLFLMPIPSEHLFPLMSSYFLTLSFFSTGHNGTPF